MRGKPTAPLAFVLLWCAFGVAGCAGPTAVLPTADLALAESQCAGDVPVDGSRELLVIVLAGPSYDVRLPLLVSDEGTALRDWSQAFKVQGPAEAGLHDGVLRVQGRGDAIVAACVQLDCCHDAFADAHWSGPDPDSFDAALDGGQADLSYSYHGESAHCRRDSTVVGHLVRSVTTLHVDHDTACKHGP